MRSKSILGIAILCVVAANAQATVIQGIDLLSQEYHVWGDVTGDIIVGYDSHGDPIYEPFDEDYDAFSNTPIIRTIVEPGGFVCALSRGDVFEVEQQTANYWPTWNWAKASVDASWVFNPLATFLDIGINYLDSMAYADAYTKIWLSDITENVELLYADRFFDQNPPYYPLPCTLTGLDTTHEYELRMLSTSYCQEGEGGWGSRVTLTLIPEPATVLLLGLGGVGLRRINRRGR